MRAIRKAVAMVVLLAAGPALAQDFSSGALDKAFPYKDLPGVRSSDDAAGKDDQAKCTQEVRLQSALRRNDFDEGRPGIVYRCEKDGIVVESPRPPLRKYWNPLDGQ